MPISRYRGTAVIRTKDVKAKPRLKKPDSHIDKKEEDDEDEICCRVIYELEV